MARAAAAIVTRVVARPAVDVLTPVPPERDRLLWRGHDPAASLARALAREWGLPCERLLQRPAGSAAQKRLDAVERKANASGLFSVDRVAPPLVGLVDDVYTTGATASAAASALREAGAIRVEVVTFARTLRRGGPTAARDRTAERLR
jgi:predicted amidophosphoribosyltransferase